MKNFDLHPPPPVVSSIGRDWTPPMDIKWPPNFKILEITQISSKQAGRLTAGDIRPLALLGRDPEVGRPRVKDNLEGLLRGSYPYHSVVLRLKPQQQHCI